MIKMWRLQIVLVPPSAQDIITFLEARLNTPQSVSPMVQYNEDIITHNNSINNCSDPSPTSPSSQNSIQSNRSSDFINYLPNCKKFLHFTDGDNTLLQLSNEILTKFDRLYPNFKESIEIVSLQDRHGCDLDSEFIIKDVFENDGVVLVILKDELDWSRNQHISLLQLARQRRRQDNKPSTKSIVTEKRKKISKEDLSSISNKDTMHLIAKSSLKNNFINKSRVSTPLMNEILPLASKYDALNKEKCPMPLTSTVVASNVHKDVKDHARAKEGVVTQGSDNNKENIPSSTQQQKNDGAKRAESKDLDLLRNSSEDADYEPADENSPQISFDSIDTDFQLSTTSHTNSDMHIQYSNPSSGAHSPRKSSLEIKVQNKKGDDLPLNDKDIGENCRRIEAFSDEEDFNETDNDRADSFINNSKKASMGFRDINSDLDSVSFNSDIENAVQSTQSTKNVVSPPFFPEKELNNRLHQSQGKEALFRLVEKEFPDKSLGAASSTSHAKDVKIQETIRKLNRFKPTGETKVQKRNSITEPHYGKFGIMKKDKPKSITSKGVSLETKHFDDPNTIISGEKFAKFGKIKVKRKTDDVGSKVIEFKRKRNMGNRSLKDIFANAGKPPNAASTIKVVKLMRDPVDNSKDKVEATSNSTAQEQKQVSPKLPVMNSTPGKRKNGQAIPSSLERTPQLKKVKVTRSHSSPSSSSSMSLESSLDSSSSDDSDDDSDSRNVQVKKINFKTSHGPAGNSNGKPMLDVDDNEINTKKYQTPKYVESDEDDQ